METRLALVTGASSGIGAATARLLAGRGWRVVLVARGRAALEAVAVEAEALGGRAVVETVDIADVQAVTAMAARLRDEHGIPEVIVNSAGAGGWRWPEDAPPAEMEAALDVPFRGAYHVTHAFLADLLARRRGTIVHVGSPASLAPWPGATAYTVSRWALRGYHEALRQDLAGTGVHTCHVLFSEVVTPYFDRNEGARERRPAIGRLVRTIPASEAAEVIVRTIDRPRPQVSHPGMLRLLVGVERVAPRPARWLVRVTGARRGRG